VSNILSLKNEICILFVAMRQIHTALLEHIQDMTSCSFILSANRTKNCSVFGWQVI